MKKFWNELATWERNIIKMLLLTLGAFIGLNILTSMIGLYLPAVVVIEAIVLVTEIVVIWKKKGDK